MILNETEPFKGVHCETTATGTLLHQLGINLSEPMLFGLGEGLGYIFWKMKSMDFPFIGGRVKPDLLTGNLARNLNLELTVTETSSAPKAWEHVKNLIDSGRMVGLKLDCFHLEYFSNPVHFAGHYVAMYGYDTQNAFLVDTVQQGSRVQTSLKSLAKARAEKGPMSSKNLYYTIGQKGRPADLDTAIISAIRKNAHEHLNPPITNIGYKGIYKTGKELLKWFDSSQHPETEFAASAMLMEKAGTGGALFRNLYRDFLAESFERLELTQLKTVHEAFSEIAEQWTEIAQLFENISRTRERTYVEEASKLFGSLSAKEKKAMEILVTI